jgi:TolB-like protein/DNA-binding winged helix-turn-helix (wHTH) protein/Tfp pilus assembly protein PilF
MSRPGSPKSLVRFGAFGVDLRAGELRKDGRRIRLQEQPFQILTLLLERPGEAVSREDLRQKLWPTDTFVDFDHGLNSAVARLRGALNDSAEWPKYVETVGRRGYRFIGTINEQMEAVRPQVSGSARAGERLAQTKADRKSLALFIGFAVITIATTSGIYLASNRAHSHAAGKTINSVAVLPFEIATANPQTESLADGITESAIDHLSRLGNLKVTSLRSVLRYQGRRVDPKQVGQDLGVQSVMIGKIDFQGARMVVLAELIDTSDGTHIWGEQYDRKVSDVLSVQEEIAREIANKLEVRLSTQQAKVLTKRYTENVEAWQTYLLGRYYWNQRSPENLRRSVTYFQQSLDHDPLNALAYAGLADSYFVLAVSGNMSPREAIAKGRAAALRALQLDDSLAEAHTSLAQITAVNDHDWEAAEKEYKRALELRPSYSTGHHYYATFLMSMGRHREALQEMEQAQKLDPLSPIIATFIGRAHYFAGRNQDSIAQYKKILASDPNFLVARTYLIQSEEQAGDFQEALHQAQAFASQTAANDSQIRKLRLAWQADGERGYWKEMLRQRLRQRGGMGGRASTSDLELAAIYARLGDNEHAFPLLERAFDEHDLYVLNLKVDPLWAKLHGDARYDDLLRRLGLQ